MTGQMHGPDILVGERLSAVTFVADYVQVHFNGPTLTFLVPVYVHTGEHQVAFPGIGGRDALCELIGAEVASVEANERVIDLGFRDGRRLSAPVTAAHRLGPEAAHFRRQADGPLMVW